MSFHGVELPFVFHNGEYVGAMHNGEQTWKTQDEIFGAWIAFARTGDPNHDGLVKWEPYTADNRAYMVFGAPSECRTDGDRELMEYMASIPEPPRPF